MSNVGTYPDDRGGTGMEIETMSGHGPVTLLIPSDTLLKIAEAAEGMNIGMPRRTLPTEA